MQVILLHWFAAQRIGLFYVKFSAEFNEISPEILEYLFWKMQENSMETSVVMYIDLILAKKHSTTDGCFRDYLGTSSGWFSVLQMQWLENVRIGVLKNLKKFQWKGLLWCTFLNFNSQSISRRILSW